MGLMRGTASAIERLSAAVFQKEKGLARQKPSQALDFHGAGNRNRTYDLRITNAPLYQLSYSGEAA
jgi:hypothetical protein